MMTINLIFSQWLSVTGTDLVLVTLGTFLSFEIFDTLFERFIR